MNAQLWDSVMAVNLLAPQRIDRALFERRRRARQRTHRSGSPRSRASPATPGRPTTRPPRPGVIGFVHSWADAVAQRGATINAVAPGFIETKMTAAMPIATREAGRRMNSLSQGGLPDRRGRDDRLVRLAGLQRGQRQRRPGVRPEPASGREPMAVRELPSSPSMAALFARAGASAIPGASRCCRSSAAAGGEMPDLTLVLNDVAVDRDRLAAYDRVCGFDLSDTLPPTYPHMLAFPLQLALMTDASFPFAAIGLVHIANEIVTHRPIRAGRAAGHQGVGDGSGAPSARAPVLAAHRGARRRRARVGGDLDQPAPRRRAAVRGASRRPGPARREPSLPAAATWKLPGRPRPPLRRGLGRHEPDPRPPAQRAPVRLSLRHRPRHVDQGPLPGRPGPRAARGVHRPGGLPQADRPARHGDLRRADARAAGSTSGCAMPTRTRRTSTARSTSRCSGRPPAPSPPAAE